MRIGITTDAMDRQPTGIGNYVYNLVKELIQLSEHDYTLIHFSKNTNELYRKAKDVIIPNIPVIPDAIKRSIYFSLKGRNFDLVHETGNIGLIFPVTFKKVLTIHDLHSYLFPETVPLGRKITMYYGARFFYPYNNIDKIIAVSENVKREIIRELKVPEEKIEVIYLGVDRTKFKVLEDKERVFSVLKEKYGIDSPFILTVTTLQPRKNVSALIKSYYKLKKRYKLNHKLAIVGGKGWKYSSIFNLVRKLNLERDIIFTGYVENKDLVLFYNAADLLVFPSIYEGFGLPPLEAMACGTPVVTSNTSSLPEVVGDAGIMIDPYDVDELANVMNEVLTNNDLKKSMSEKGLRRAQIFNWKDTAKKTLKVYEEVISQD